MMICTKLVSFPTRERGLKLALINHAFYRFWSFPTRERGLKLIRLQRRTLPNQSFPTRECGLKRKLR